MAVISLCSSYLCGSKDSVRYKGYDLARSLLRPAAMEIRVSIGV